MRRFLKVFAITAAAVGLVGAPAAAQQQRPAAGTTSVFVPPATLLGDDGRPAAGGAATAGSNCSIPNIAASPSGDAIYFSNGGRSDLFRMTTANRKGEGAGQFSIYNFPDMPYPNNPNQQETHIHDLAVGPNGNVWVANVHRRGGPTGRAAAAVEFTSMLQRLSTVDIPNEPEPGNQSFTGGVFVAPNGDVWMVTSEFTGPEEITLVRPDGTTRTYIISPELTQPGQTGVTLQGPLVFADGFVYAAGQRTVAQQTATGMSTRTTGEGVVVRLDPNSGTVTTETVTPSTDPIYYPAGSQPDAPFTIEVVRNANVTLIDQHAGYVPGRIEVAPDGTIWWVEQQRVPAPTATNPFATAAGGQGRIAVLDPATGQVRHYTLPAGTNPQGLTVGGDGRIWYTSATLAASPANPGGARGYIGALDPETGQVEEFAAPAGATNLGDIDTGQAGDVYYAFRTAAGECAIGQIWVCSGNMGNGPNQGRGRAVCAPGHGGLPRGQGGGQNR